MLPGGGRASLIASLRRFYLALFLVFLLLTLFAAYIYFEADLSAVNQRAIASNFEAFRQIEFENEKQLSKLRENLGKEAQFTTFESVERFRTNYEKINQRLLVDYLSQRELRLVHLNEVKPPLLILPFNLYRKEFERLSHSIQDIFSEVRWVRAMDLVGFPKDDLPIWESLSSLKIKPVIDLDRQRILLRRKDFEKLDDLDGVQDLRFSNQVFNENICWRILRVGSDDLIKYDADDFLGKRRASPHYFSSLSDLESPMQWSVLFLMRK
ncbi:hypothetical protein HOF92_07760, partial [bacterium]|nr:hypothetical protein [bacterium]